MDLSWRSAGILLACWGFGAQIASAETVSLTGLFAQDDQVDLIDFSVDATAVFFARTLSYAGGLLADGRVIAPGGFDPNLALFDARGHLLEQEDDDRLGVVARDPITDEAYDSSIRITVTPGVYVLAVTQSNSWYDFNAALALIQGPSQAGHGNFTGALYPCSNGSFCDFTGSNRTNFWALDYSLGPVPEPAAIVWLLSGLCLLLYRRRRVHVTFHEMQHRSR